MEQILTSFIYDEGVRYLVQEMQIGQSKLEINVSTVIKPDFRLPGNAESVLDDILLEENTMEQPYVYSGDIDEDSFAVTCSYWMNPRADDDYKELVKGALMTGVRSLAKRIMRQFEIETMLEEV